MKAHGVEIAVFLLFVVVSIGIAGPDATTALLVGMLVAEKLYAKS